ncbi:hypothetical protein AAFN47_26920 [Hoeflea sp. CAU 1731]
MSFADCLKEAVSGGELSSDDAARLERDFKRFEAHHRTQSAATADAEAKRALAELLEAESAHKKRQAKLAIKSIRRIDADLQAHRNAGGWRDIAGGALDMLEHFGTAAFSSVEGRRRAIIGMAHAQMENLLHHFRRGAIGGDKARWHRAQLDNVVREAFGEATGDAAAKGFATSWGKTADWLRRRFNAAGGAIGKLENWGLPQHHDARALRKRGLQQWKEDIRPMLDAARMVHPLTGERVGREELDDILDDVFLSIVTDGWNRREPKRQAMGRGALANQRAEHRFLTFRDADSWLAYQRAYGGNDPFATMMGHINMMARDIAAMEVLGPNPQGTIEWLKQAVTKEAHAKAAGKPSRFAGKPERALDRASVATHRIDAVWGSIRGTLETPVNGWWANVASAGRSLITSSVLGSAAISALSDLGTSMVAREFAGIASRGALPETIRAMLPATRREGVASGLILDNAMHVFHAQARYVGTLGGPEWARYLADRVLTYSGLTPFTQAGRHAFGLAFQHEAAKRAGQAFADLPELLRNTFRRYGITAHQWDLIRKAELHDGGNGVAFLRPVEIAERIDPALAERWLEMIQAETEYAIPSTSHRSRTAMIDQNRPGTFIGEVVRSFAQFKSFGAVMILLHGRRMFHLVTARETRPLGAAYAGGLLIATAVFGALALQIKQVAAGRDPRDMTTKDFWGGALLQGGGLGIYGDFLFADINRYGGGFASTVAGPVIERANDFWNLTAGNAVQLASGEKTHFGRELVKFARGNVPGSNIWYLRLAWERLLMDQLQYLADPEANAAFKRQQQYWKREYGQEFYWRPGERMPSRWPDVGGVAGW